MNNLSFMFEKYTKFTPTFRYIKHKFFNKDIKKDHIAHRSFNYEPIIDFYKSNSFHLKNDKYYFPDMNVKATWMNSRYDNEFRVFVSQYNGTLNNNFIIKNYSDYLEVKKNNDYIAWTLLHKNDINHIAIEVNDIYDFVKIIKEDRTIKLNNEENPINVSKDGNLLQASTICDKILYRFSNNEINLVPYTFVEFVQRKNKREGFETSNAKEIFKSTNI